MTSTLLRPNAAVIAGRVVTGARVLVHDGIVADLGPDLIAPPGAITIDLAATLLPGAVDLQVNGAGGHDCSEATPAALDVVARACRSGGAAAFLPTLITADLGTLCARAAAIAAWIDAGPPADGATPLGIHLEGPFLEVPGAHDPAWFVDPTDAHIDRLLTACRGHLRLVTLAPGRAGAAAATARLRAAGVAVALGHAASTTGFAECVAAGAGLVTHLFNAMSPMRHRDPGIAGLALDEPRLRCSLILDGVHVHPAVVRNAWRILGSERTVVVTDAVAAAGMPDGEYQLSGGSVRLVDGVVRDREDRLAGAALTMSTATRNLRQQVPGIGADQIASVIATNPAAVIGAERHGRIEVGLPAVFSLLGDDHLEVFDATG